MAIISDVCVDCANPNVICKQHSLVQYPALVDSSLTIGWVSRPPLNELQHEIERLNGVNCTLVQQRDDYAAKVYRHEQEIEALLEELRLTHDAWQADREH